MHIVHELIDILFPESWLPVFQHNCGKNGDNNIQLDNRMRMMASNYLRETCNCLNYPYRAISLNFPDESRRVFFVNLLFLSLSCHRWWFFPTSVDIFLYLIKCWMSKGRMASPKRMNFRKSSKRGGGHFQSKNLYCRFWTLNRAFSA